MNKLLILTNSIPDYRVPVYKELSNYYELTVAHFGIPLSEDNFSIPQIILKPFQIGPFVFFKNNIFRLAQKFDSLLVMGDLHVIPYVFLGFWKKRNFSLTFWGGDVSFSYKKKYDADRRFDFIRFFIMNRADSLVFYSDYPVARYVSDGGITARKLFVANNSVYVGSKCKLPDKKKYFLFVGTLYREKKIFDLLEAYYCSLKVNNDLQPLLIVGDGAERLSIEKWLDEKKLTTYVQLLGAIYDTKKLKDVFLHAIACISPGQAGLSVLSSMAYGVPYVTNKDAITGGEIFNIKDGVNGILLDGSIDSLAKTITLLSVNEKYVKQLSINAQNHYYEKASFENMVNGLINSINFASEYKREVWN